MATDRSKLPISLQNLSVFKKKVVDDILTKVTTLNTNAEEAKHKADIARSAALSAGAKEAAFILPSANWVKLDRTYGDYKYSAEIALSGITNQYTCNVIFDMESIEAAISYRIAPTCNIDANKVVVYSMEEPDMELSGVIVYGQCENASGVGRTNVTITNTYYPRIFAAWDNREIMDANGNVSTMVRIPSMTWRELGVGTSNELFPAFIVNGKPVKALWIGKYKADANGCSVKGATPKANLSLDAAYALCKSMGNGWHLNTRLTYMVEALWSAKYDCQPAITPDGAAAGAMDATHSHNGLDSGVWDMAGPINEWNAGVRLVQGELQVISADGVTFDNSAITIKTSSNSENWYCINGLTGELMKPDGSGTTTNSLKMNNGQWNTTSAATYLSIIDSITVDSKICEKAKNMLIALGMILPEGITSDGDDAWFYKNAESIPAAGGYVPSAKTHPGIFYLYVGHPCSHGNDPGISFRAAYCEL